MSYNLRYTLDFNITQDDRQPLVFDDATLEIYEKDGVDAPETILGVENPIQINYQNTSEQILEPFIGSEATLNLIATEDFQLQDLYTEDELRWLINIKRNGSVIWRGFIIPDGCQESFTFTPYTISVNAVDTLGLLKNLSYVQNDGNFWLGKQTFIEVIYNCLNRVQIPDMNIYTCVNITEESYPDGDADDPLNLTYVNAETYLESDNINPLNCQQVLDNVLRIFTAVIIQSEGDWYIFRPNELALSDTLVFRKYINGVYDSFVTKTVGQVLGGHTEGAIIAPLYHTDTDQLKTIEKPFKNNSMAFKYGENRNLQELFSNPTLFAGQGCGGDPIGPCDDVTITAYTKTGTMYAGLWPTTGVIFYNQLETFPNTNNYNQSDDTITVVRNITTTDRVRFTINYLNPDPLALYGADMNFVISLTDGSTIWYLQADLNWAITALEPGVNYYQVRSDTGVGGTLTINSALVPSGGTVTFRILAPSGTSEDIVYTLISCSVFNDISDQVGEIHTATQTGNFTFVPPTINVLNGDSINEQYMGAMFETDETTLTSNWYRNFAPESLLAEPFASYKPLLRLAVEETERLHARPYIKFDGTIFGYFNPLSRFVINLLEGYFMPIKMNYDIQANKTQTTLRRVINEEIEQDYTLEPDYGATTKVFVR
jgi:hypothetical protein